MHACVISFIRQSIYRALIANMSVKHCSLALKVLNFKWMNLRIVKVRNPAHSVRCGVATPVVLTGVHAEEIREGANNAVVVCSHKVTDIFCYAQPCPYLFSSLSCNYHLFYLFLYRNTLPEFNFSRGFPKLVIVIAKSDIPEHNRRRWLSYSLLFVQTSFSLIAFSRIRRGKFSILLKISCSVSLKPLAFKSHSLTVHSLNSRAEQATLWVTAARSWCWRQLLFCCFSDNR